LSQFKKYYPSGYLKINNLGIFQSLKLRIVVKKILRISLKLNFTPDTLGCHGLISLRVIFFLIVLIKELQPELFPEFNKETNRQKY